ncbi:hydroxyethylthiazole kinase [Desulfallas thermosapovorans]|uniref:Hydroxyethylthiazole kinase n=1 Tax=Desulfallas thermosapovorans DSM 6562 TaxID=1121431 RepID=A0A5S4ZY99_9FIRM|nr:hydroxyethylthiazole kinase [Desulfallas thermosapovorans]TYO98002.1 hydroxyethylthiazole kinase [Desulfallas thermosapovorans DSM 6562]
METSALLKKCAELWDAVRRSNPLVHCITNYVTVNDVANTIIASGASPAMVENPAEAGDFAALAAALYINPGTLTTEQEAAIMAAAGSARENKVPGLLDPVGCSAIPGRRKLYHRLQEIEFLKVVKGNIAEIKSLAGVASKARGVDSLDSGDGLDTVCRELSRRDNIVVVATGAVDVVADARQVASTANGTHLFQQITGAGCMVGGVMAACLGAAPEEPWLASVTGLLGFNIAGERAARQTGDRPGSFRIALVDRLYQLRGDDVIKEGRVQCW